MAVCHAEAHQPERAADALAAARRGFAAAERDSWWPVTAAMMTEASTLLAHPSAAELEGELEAFTGRGIVYRPGTSSTWTVNVQIGYWQGSYWSYGPWLAQSGSYTPSGGGSATVHCLT